MKKAVKKTDGKYLTESRFKRFENSFESNMRSIAQSFARVDKSLDRINRTLITHEAVMQVMLKEIRTIHEDNKYFRASISTLYTDHLAHDKKIDNITVRVEKLELKSK